MKKGQTSQLASKHILLSGEEKYCIYVHNAWHLVMVAIYAKSNIKATK